MPRDFVAIAERIVDELLSHDPVLAHWSGDHRVDDRLPDFSEGAVRDHVTMLRDASHTLAEVEPSELPPTDAVDLEILQAAVDASLFAYTDTREHEWNPLVYNPGFLLNGQLSRAGAPAAERLAAVAGRLAALPDVLATADRTLADCPRVHLETAVSQWDGTAALVREGVDALAAELPAGDRPAQLDAVQAAALKAIENHQRTLRTQLETATGDGRLGQRLWEAKLWHTLDSGLSASEILAAAEHNLERVTAEITEVAAKLTGDGDPRAAFDLLAADRPDNNTVLTEFAAAMDEITAFVTEHEIISLVDDPYEIVEMPKFARGTAGAYCDPPGPLEPARVPTFLAVSPAPADWSPARVDSYYRELNNHMVRNLAIHEAVPGHHLQLAVARGVQAGTRVRSVCVSGSFIEGWAVYAEQIMAEYGFGGPAVRMQQLKMQLRMTINAIIDQRVHCADMTESEAMALMTGRGFQEESEAAAKWRRTLLTSTQLSTYFVGYTEISAIAGTRPDGTALQSWHDRLLSAGSPPPRHLTTLLDA